MDKDSYRTDGEPCSGCMHYRLCQVEKRACRAFVEFAAYGRFYRSAAKMGYGAFAPARQWYKHLFSV